ncbi:hypothetical protein NA56DRAFT_328826 [Hyaloscypha hepaticicola]|uniref:Uncharacterized protein n=1 Tax=Hyaloscypha hepaticicola TaxID=2082293 RepID=A0A2J6PP59_9HELO|nr:hypothetical protein NA56DRAFT_328826 [Hyaloscypha hepaticicola]
MGSALWTHKADGRPVGAKRWYSKYQKTTHDTPKCWADETCVYCHKKGHIEKDRHIKDGLINL